MRRAIVHIGMPRTGSSTFQFVLWQLRPELERMGILYPDLTPRSAAQTPHMNHQHFGEALDGRRPRAERRELLDRLSGQLATTSCDTVLISYEDLIQEKRAAEIAGTLRAVFDRHDFQMEAIVAAKPQSEHLNSIYAHRMQLMREKRLFTAFVPAFKTSGRFNYGDLLEPWLYACSGRVHGVPFRDTRSVEPLIRRFLIAAGLDARVGPNLARDDLSRIENRSPGPVAVEISRRLRLSRFHARVPTRPRAAMHHIETMVLERGFDQMAFKGVWPELRAEMECLYSQTNDRFARALWGQPWSSVVRPEPVAPVNEIGDGPIEPETEACIQGVMTWAYAIFNVSPDRSWTGAPVEWVLDVGGWLERKLRVSKWRVM